MHLQINTNGYLVIGTVTADEDIALSGPFPSRSQVAAIAPFNSDMDITAYPAGFISYRLDATPAILAQATDAVMAIGQYAQELPTFQATWTLVLTWHDVVAYGASGIDSTTVSVKISHCAVSVHTPLEVGQNFLYLKIVLFHEM